MARLTRRFATVLIALGAALTLLGLTQVAVSASTPEGKITICHRTASTTNPYVRITVDNSAADGDLSNDNGRGDHFAEHKGPIFPATGSDGKWGDIIPPMPGVHSGLNWTAEGQAIWNNDCNMTVLASPTPTPAISPVTSPSPSPATSPSPAVSPSPSAAASPAPARSPSPSPGVGGPGAGTSGAGTSGTSATGTGPALAETGSGLPGQGLGLLLIALGLLLAVAGGYTWARKEA